MAQLLIRSKLHIPISPSGIVPRPDLFEKLERGLESGNRLILISAPAGFGKTTLAGNWITTHIPPLNVAWVSLDERDNAVTQFWAYVITALQAIQPDFGIAALSTLSAPESPPVSELLPGLINELDQLPQTILALDDYHLIQTLAIHESLALLLDYLPPQLHLLLTSRADPPLSLARLRARQQMVEIREIDLRFKSDEAKIFLNQVKALALTEEHIQKLISQTEGWITGLQMAALSLRGQTDAATCVPTDVEAFIAGFAGTHRYVLDYLIEEVLNREPEHVQRFLLRTSILNRLCGPLCDAVLAGDGVGTTGTRTKQQWTGQETLEYLENSNLFVVPLDEQRYWYRYHRLFADLLYARAKLKLATDLPRLHNRASLWYEQQGILDEATEHVIAAKNVERLEKLIENYGVKLLFQGELGLVERWLLALPESKLDGNIDVGIIHAWTLLLTGRSQSLEKRLQQIESLLAKSPHNPRHGDVAAIRAYVTAHQGDIKRTIELAQVALATLNAENYGIRGIVFFVLGGAQILKGDYSAAMDALRQASELGIQGGNIHVAVPALNALAGIEIQQGNLDQAQQTAQRAVDLATPQPGIILPIAGGVLTTLADIAYELGDFPTALAYAQKGLELTQRWGNKDTLYDCYLTLAHVLIGQGNYEHARQYLEKTQELPLEYTPSSPLYAKYRALSEQLEAAGDKSALNEGTRTPMDAQDSASLLTNREAEILALVARGLSNRDIAQELFVAESTVKSHLNSVYSKLGVKNRTQAIAKVQE